MKKILLGFGIVLLGGLSAATSAYASTEYAYIPDTSIRNNIIEQLGNSIEAQQLPSILDVSNLNGGLSINPSRSLEGLQYATNIENLTLNPSESIVDYRPISGLKNLKTYYSMNSLGSDMDRITDIHSFSDLENIESLYLGYANVLDLTPLENLKNLKSFFSTGATMTLPKEYVSNELKTFIIENPVKYSSQFTNITIQASNENGELTEAELSDNAIIIRNLEPSTQNIYLTLCGSSENFDWNKGFQSTMNFEVPISWY